MCVCVCGGGGGGGSLTYVGAGNFFGVQNFEFQFFSGFQKNEYFWGMMILWTFLGGYHKIRLYLGVISMHFWGLLKVKVQNRGILGGC